MLKNLRIRNFTVFAEADFEFRHGLNVIVGTNGTGKSHVLKLGYVVARAGAKIWSEVNTAQTARDWQVKLASRLNDVFQPESLGKLVRHGSKPNSAHIQAEFVGNAPAKIDFSFSASAAKVSLLGKQYVTVKEFPKGLALAPTIFIPPKEVLTMAWLREQYDLKIMAVDNTYPALLYLLESPPSRKLTLDAEQALVSLEKILGGRVEKEGDRFYLTSAKRSRVEMNLVAEGMRKFGMLEKLLRNGSLTAGNTLFWDEPEANLNPALLRKLAALLVMLSAQGFQIILATHSLFLLKEFHVLAQREKAPIRYFGLFEGPAGDTQVEITDDFETLEHIAALDAELEQTVDFQQALDHEDAV